jgi:two-component system phosphate regulon sensor histidine kinase PhoR
MPRTPVVWHIFAGWCGLVAALLAGCFWLSSVQLARLAEEAQRRRLLDVADRVGQLLPKAEQVTPGAFLEATRQHRQGRMVIEILGRDGAVVATTADETSTAPAGGAAAEPEVVEATRTGRPAAASHYDVASGRRLLALAVPLEPAGAERSILRVTDVSTDLDKALGRGQRTLLVGAVACGLAALGAGYLLARRSAQPIRELSAAAGRLAAGDVEAPLPAAESAELADLAAALAGLREQLVERGITIGRQGTQQEAVLGSMIEGVLAIDARQRIVGINRAAADLLGLDLDDVARRSLQEVVRNPDLRRFALRAIDCREPVEDDLVIHGVRDRTIRLRGTALRDASGEGGAVIVLNDVTDVQRLENVRRDFVANVSHELKTPIASIKGFVETLLDGAADDPEANRRFLGIIARQSDRLAAIIEDLLALSRIEQREGAGNLPLEEARIADLLAAAVADCEPRAAERGIAVECACPEDLVAEVNPPLLEQALINLVDNAIKYSDPGKTIWLAAAREPDGAGHPGGLSIRVRDEGCGIAAEHLPRLFERFYRVDKARSRAQGGTGLGLAIVKHIVQAHAGTIGVESEPQVGTTFTIRLPLERA